MRTAILETKRQHLSWGGQFIQGELCRRRFKVIPHRRTIECFLHQYPEFPWQRHRKRQPLQDARRATRLHQLWQIDFIVEQTLHGAEQKYSFLQMRDMASTRSILKYPLPEGRCALTSKEMIPLCRQAFSKASYLPEAIRTDHGSCFIGVEKHSFPSDFTLYLWGLGIEHELIPVRCPAKNGGVERDQRTFGEHFTSTMRKLSASFRTNMFPRVRCAVRGARLTKQPPTLSAKPSHTNRCGRSGCSPLIGFTPNSLSCAGHAWSLATDASPLGHYKYYVGWAFKGKEIEVCFDPQSKEFIFCSSDKGEVKGWSIKGISYEKIVKEQNLSPNK